MKKKRVYKKRRVPRAPRKTFSQPEWASCTEVVRGAVLESNTMYGPTILQMSQFKRSSQIAQNYQQYRITGVTLRFTPRFDTFPATTSGADQIVVPYLYYIVDRIGALRDNVTLAQLQSMGAKPHRFDDKTITVKYKPGVLTSVATGGATSVPNRYTISPWLNTQDLPSTSDNTVSQVDHYGLWYVLDAKTLPGDGQYEYDVDIQVDLQFRKALIATVAGAAIPKQGGNVLPLATSTSA